MIIHEKLRIAFDLQELAIRRGEQYLVANDDGLSVCDGRVIFDELEVDVLFTERTRNDCPDRYSTVLSIADLSMSDVEWEQYIVDVRTAAVKRADESKKKREEEALANKRRQLDSLKKELGEK